MNKETVKSFLLMIIEQEGTIKRKDLLSKLRREVSFSDHTISDRKMRLFIMELIKDGHPIMSSEKGYSLIRNENDLTSAISYLKVKAKSISVRANMLIRNFNKRNNTSYQYALEL